MGFELTGYYIEPFPGWKIETEEAVFALQGAAR
jgi:hypothetical protein